MTRVIEPEVAQPRAAGCALPSNPLQGVQGAGCGGGGGVHQRQHQELGWALALHGAALRPGWRWGGLGEGQLGCGITCAWLRGATCMHAVTTACRRVKGTRLHALHKPAPHVHGHLNSAHAPACCSLTPRRQQLRAPSVLRAHPSSPAPRPSPPQPSIPPATQPLRPTPHPFAQCRAPGRSSPSTVPRQGG